MDPVTPARLVPGLAEIEPNQAGLPRVIHPIGLLVGQPEPTLTTQGVIAAMSDARDIEITEDAVHKNAAGDPIQFRKGDRVSAAYAAQFPSLADKVESDGTAGLARPQAERDANQAADEKAGLVEKRASRGPNRNRADAPPENR